MQYIGLPLNVSLLVSMVAVGLRVAWVDTCEGGRWEGVYFFKKFCQRDDQNILYIGLYSPNK